MQKDHNHQLCVNYTEKPLLAENKKNFKYAIYSNLILKKIFFPIRKFFIIKIHL